MGAEGCRQTHAIPLCHNGSPREARRIHSKVPVKTLKPSLAGYRV